MNRRHTAALAATAIAALSLTACGGEEGANIEEDPSTTVSPTGYDNGTPEDPDASTTDSELPPEATKKTKAGAIAFNKYYQEQLGNAYPTGETEALERSANKKCTNCYQFIDATKRDKSLGVVMNKNPKTIKDIRASAKGTGYNVEVDMASSVHHQVLKNDQKGRTYRAATYTVVTDTRWIDNGWQIFNYRSTNVKEVAVKKS